MSYSSEHNESQLLDKVAKGDPAAFYDLVCTYKDSLYTAALRMMQNRERAEDCVQDVFMKIWINRSSLTSVDNFGGWLHTVTRNTLLSALKRLAREQLVDFPADMNVLASERTVEDLLTQKEQAGLLKAAFATLSDRQRAVYRLVKENGLSREEAASQLMISLDTVKFHLAEATRKIRAYVFEHGDISLIILLAIKNY